MASAKSKISNPDPHRVLGKIVYASRNDQRYAKEKPYNLRYVPAHDIARTNIQYEVARDVSISDLRSANIDFSHNGIRVVELQSKMGYDDFSNEKSIEKIYLREARDCIRNATGTQEVYIFEWQVRRRHKDFPFLPKQVDGEQSHSQPVLAAHIDYTPGDIKEYVRHLFREKSDKMLERDYDVLNLWKPLRGPVLDWPIAFCDPATVDTGTDLMALDDVFTGTATEVYNMHYNPMHRWYYLSRQTSSEAVLFKTFCSKMPEQCGVPHCAFELKNSSLEDVLPRESIEIRAFAFYGD